jgi:hypothetical protein
VILWISEYARLHVYLGLLMNSGGHHSDILESASSREEARAEKMRGGV